MFNNKKKTKFQIGLYISICIVCVSQPSAEAGSPKRNVKEGSRLYSQGNYMASENKFNEALKEDPESEIVNFNLGTALYKNGNYEKAIEHFQKAFLSDSDQLKQKSYYNLGNTLYKLGMKQEKENNVVFAVSSLEKSLSQFERALSIDEEEVDAKHNFNFVKNELKRLQEIQNQQQQGQGDKSDKSEQQQQNNRSNQSQDQRGQEGQQQSEDEQDNQQDRGEQQNQQNQEQSEQSRGDDGEGDDKSQQNAGAQSQSASELTKQEARMLLESYQQTEEPQGPLNMQKKKVDPRSVLKDW